MNCLFCRIIAGEIPSEKVYEDERVLAFRDIDPQAPVHVLIIPKEHYSSVVDAPADIIGYMAKTAVKIAEDEGILNNGFRLVANTGDDAGQSVKHLHMHLLGGRSMKWPPG